MNSAGVVKTLACVPDGTDASADATPPNASGEAAMGSVSQLQSTTSHIVTAAQTADLAVRSEVSRLVARAALVSPDATAAEVAALRSAVARACAEARKAMRYVLLL